MGEIKSAFEKALEKAERLEKLSPEEMRERKGEEYAPIGRALADRYLGHGYGEILGEEANKHSGEERDIVTRAALSRLVEAMELGNYEITQRAMEGILVLKGKEKFGEVKDQIKSLFDEYKQAEKERYEEEKGEIERKERGLLHQLRISGSAVGEINLEASETWEEICQELYSRYDKILEDLKVQLLQAVA